MTAAPDIEKGIAKYCAAHRHNPLGFVRGVYPWGKAGTILSSETGPDDWQADVLTRIGEASKSGENLMLGRASGHGIGKTALIAWIIHWFCSTRPFPQVVVTANTKVQLETKTWRELAKCKGEALNGHWFAHKATKYIYTAGGDDVARKWFASAIPWSKERPEAFAGTHERHTMMLFDEGSAIPDIIYETAEGAMTTPGSMTLVFGNPTQNTGKFYRIFHGERKSWDVAQIDSRDCKMSNQNTSLFERWISDYGEDSDFVRVRMKGQFPRRGTIQLIGVDTVETAQGRRYKSDAYRHAPKILGVDVARFGDDQSVIIRRQGVVASGLQKFREIDTMDLASKVAEEIDDWNPDAVFVDEVGIGAGVIDRLHQLRYRRVIGINVGRNAIAEKKYFNLRAEIWVKLRDWLESVGMIPNDQELYNDLIGVQFGYDAKERYQLERKIDMKARGELSPDCGDGLALTFSQPVSVHDDRIRAINKRQKKPYNPREHFTNGHR